MRAEMMGHGTRSILEFKFWIRNKREIVRVFLIEKISARAEVLGHGTNGFIRKYAK